MVKRKSLSTCSRAKKYGEFHMFALKEIPVLQTRLLDWYNTSKRDLPWRKQDVGGDTNKRAYAVWVSEIMLQQTQVATVIDYYTKWMKKWPDMDSLAKASLEEVNEMWSGLGYYSRGRRLHEGACKVVKEMDGQMPSTASDLCDKLPGVGKYTAGAIASIAFNECTGLVDGNVMRVFSRLRMIGSDITSQHTADAFWSIANTVVDKDNPGDFNQALMELGATVCLPKNPNCSQCPVQNLCKSYTKNQQSKENSAAKLCQKEQSAEAQILDIECAADGCSLCLPDDEPWVDSLGVTNYPRKGKKKAARENRTAVAIVERHDSDGTRYLILQRPEKGLLAGLWEFPGVDIENSADRCLSTLSSHLSETFQLDDIQFQREVPEVLHLFSHIRQTYVPNVFKMKSKESNADIVSKQPHRWVTTEEMSEAALSTAMRKVFKACQSDEKTAKKAIQKTQDNKKQLGLESFFKPKSK